MIGSDHLQTDLFGPVSDQTFRETACAECGAAFATTAGMGRPQRFCSDTCRRNHQGQQIRAWMVLPAETPPAECAGCGEMLAPRAKPGGRFRRFCTPDCRMRTRRLERRAPAFEIHQSELWKGPTHEADENDT